MAYPKTQIRGRSSILSEVDKTVSYDIIGRKTVNVNAGRVDTSTDSIQTIDYAHHEIHSGDAYYVNYSVASLGAMAAPDDMITLTFTTPNTTEWSHFTFKASGTAGWRLRLIEAPSGGAASPTGQLTILNHDRNSTNTSSITDGTTANQVNYDATLATGGTTIWDQYLEGSGGPQSSGLVSGGRDEIILKQNTKYQLSLYGTDSNPASLYINWYEHTNIY